VIVTRFNSGSIIYQCERTLRGRPLLRMLQLGRFLMSDMHGNTAQFERLVLVVIGLNAVVLVASLIIDGHERQFDGVHNAILAFLALEPLVRVRRVRWRVHTWLRRPGNLFGTAVIALSFLPALGVDASLLRVARLARLVHLMRHASHLRLSRLLVLVTCLPAIKRVGPGAST
jgi:Ion transport protein